MQTPQPTPEPRPGFAIVAFALGVSGLGLAVVCMTTGAAFAAKDVQPDWLPIALGAALADAVISMEMGRRAGPVGPPHSQLRKVGTALALAAILLTLAAGLSVLR